MQYDAIILGSGPAGVCASIYLGRAKLKTLILGKPEESQLSSAAEIENFFSFPPMTDGKKLLEEAITQSRNFGTEFSAEKAVSNKTKTSFEIISEKNQIFTANYLILGIGNLRENKKELIKSLKLKIKDNIILTNRNNETNVKNCYAVGNCATEIKQLPKDLGDGCNAAINIIKKTKKMKEKEIYVDYGPVVSQ